MSSVGDKDVCCRGAEHGWRGVPAEEQGTDDDVSLCRNRAWMGTAHCSLLCSPRSAPREQTGCCCPSITPTQDLVLCRRWLHLFNPLWPQTWLGLHPHNMGSSQVWGERVLSTGPSLAPVKGDWTQRHWELPIPASSFAQQQGGEWLPTAKVCIWVMG